ncbi:MAG: filamentous hemagglutinin N-terminal domain-containing protein, partial [Pseudomonadota bacterium]|nr:filamentous hemagglutinin N-terminal domain-containing protein [Pseudomonadota bacterium]
AAVLAPCAVYALPQGGVVVAGQASITSPNPNHIQIAQASDRAVINWDSFNLAQQDSVKINQPSATAALLNRVQGDQLSTIAGRIEANGQVFIVNPNGVTFSNGAIVKVGALVATTADIDNAAFMRGGRLNFNQAGQANSTIRVERGASIEAQADVDAFVAFIAPQVRHAGVITSKLGTVQLAAGEMFTLDVGGGLLSLLLSQQDLAQLGITVEQSGAIISQGGLIQLQVASLNQVLQGFIQQNGRLAASEFTVADDGTITLTAAKGQVALQAQDLQNAGTIYAEQVRLNAGQDIVQAGVLYATETAELNAQQGKLTVSGRVQAEQELSLTAQQSIQQTAQGQWLSGGVLSAQSVQSDVVLAGQIQATDQIMINAQQGRVQTVRSDARPSIIQSSSAGVEIDSKTADLAGLIRADGGALQVNAEQITLTGSAQAKIDIQLNAQRDLQQSNASQLIADGAIRLTSSQGNLSLAGKNQAAGDLHLSALQGTLQTVAGEDQRGGSQSTNGQVQVEARSAQLGGALVAQAGALTVTADQVDLTGNLKAHDALTVAVRGQLNQSDDSQLLSEGTLNLSSQQADVRLAGKLVASADIDISAQQGALTLGSAEHQQGGLRTSSGNVQLSARTVDIANTVLVDAGSLQVTAGQIDLSGSAHADENILLHADNQIQQTNASNLIAGQTLRIESTQSNLLLAGKNQAQDQIALIAQNGSITTSAGADGLGGFKSTDAGIHVQARIANLGGALLADGAGMAVAAEIIDLSGQISAAGNLELNASNRVQQSAGSNLNATGSLSMQSDQGNVTLAGKNQAEGDVTLRAQQGTVSTSAGADGQAGTRSVTGGLTVESRIANLGGTLRADGGAMSVNAEIIDLNGSASSTADFRLTANNSIRQAVGSQVQSGGVFALQSSQGNITLAGKNQAIGDISLSARQGNITTQAGSDGQAGSQSVMGNVSLTAQTASLGGVLRADGGTLTVTADNIDLQGDLQSKTDTRLIAQNRLQQTQTSNLLADGGVSMQVAQGNLSLAGQTQAHHDIDLQATQGSIQLDGAIQTVEGDLTIQARGDVSQNPCAASATPATCNSKLLVDQGLLAIQSRQGNLDLGYLRAREGIDATASQGSIYFNRAIGGANTGYVDPHPNGLPITADRPYATLLDDYQGYQDNLRPDTGYLHATAGQDIFINGLNLDGSEQKAGLQLIADRNIVSNALIAVNKGDLIFGDLTRQSAKIFLGNSVYSRGIHRNGILSQNLADHQFYNIRLNNDLVVFDNTDDYGVKTVEGVFSNQPSASIQSLDLSLKSAKIVISNNSTPYDSIQESSKPIGFIVENANIYLEKDIFGLTRAESDTALTPDFLADSSNYRIVGQNHASQFSAGDQRAGMFVELVSTNTPVLRSIALEDQEFVLQDQNTDFTGKTVLIFQKDGVLNAVENILDEVIEFCAQPQNLSVCENIDLDLIPNLPIGGGIGTSTGNTGSNNNGSPHPPLGDVDIDIGDVGVTIPEIVVTIPELVVSVPDDLGVVIDDLVVGVDDLELNVGDVVINDPNAPIVLPEDRPFDTTPETGNGGTDGGNTGGGTRPDPDQTDPSNIAPNISAELVVTVEQSEAQQRPSEPYQDTCVVLGQALPNEADLGQQPPLLGAARNVFGNIYPLLTPDVAGVGGLQAQPLDQRAGCEQSDLVVASTLE